MNKAGNVGAIDRQPDALLSDSALMLRLRERATDCRQKSMTARLAVVLDLVEEILQRGYDRSQVREMLIGIGWYFTTDSFDSALSRLRKRRSSVSSGGKVTTQHPVTGVVGEPNAATTEDEKQHTSFSDVFLERKDFTAGRKWK